MRTLIPQLAVTAIVLVSTATAFAGGDLDLTASRWFVTGFDLDPWTAKLVFDEHNPDGSVAGHFDWLSPGNDNGGRELFEGTYNADTRRIRLDGFEVQCAAGIVRCVYIATVLPDGSGMTDGVWGGGDCLTGAWAAFADRCPDITGDRVVDHDDLLQLVSSWGPCSTHQCPLTCGADINADGVVDALDFLTLLGRWGCSGDG